MVKHNKPPKIERQTLMKERSKAGAVISLIGAILALFLIISLVLPKSNKIFTQWIDGSEKTAYQ